MNPKLVKLENYFKFNAEALIARYNEPVNARLKEVMLYIDPQECKIRADVCFDNGDRLPLLLDADTEDN